MPISKTRLARLLLASGLLMLVTFASAKAQEPAVDPNQTDIQYQPDTSGDFAPVAQLAAPEIDYDNCGPAPGAWHPPIFYPNPTLFCPTGVVHRDWFREKTLGCLVGKRQRMLEKDYQWRVANGGQPTCCPPHSCWGHSCECCPGIGCRKGFGCFGNSCENASGSCGTACGVNQGCNSAPHASGDETSAVDGQSTGIVLVEYVVSSEDAPVAQHTQPQVVQTLDYQVDENMGDQVAQNNESPRILLVSDQRVASNEVAGIEPAGFCEVNDSCTQSGCPQGGCPQYSRGAYCPQFANGRPCPLHRGGFNCPLHRRGYGYGDECEDDGPYCDCVACRLKDCFCRPFGGLCYLLHADGEVRNGNSQRGRYHIAYPVNPYHFDQRDGRIYAAQGYGQPIGVPLAPQVEHTYNYGWGLPSSRLTPISRMPGAPGVANPAVPGAAGPGIYPQGFPNIPRSGYGN